MNWKQWLNWASLKLYQSESPRRDSEILLGHVIKKSRVQLLAFGETVLKQNQIKKLRLLINRRITGEPIAYLIGSIEFWSLTFKISSGVFIPRPDTECLVEKVLNLAPNNFSSFRVLDLGTGIGAIALTLASERSNWDIIGIDQQKKALKLANKNKLLLNLNHVNFIYGNWFMYLQSDRKFDLIVSNPPYISKQDLCYLSQDIFFEPKSALISNHAGLSDLFTICKYSSNYLKPYGWIFLEHGWDQGKFVREFLYQFKFINICTVFDHNQNERVTYGQWKPVD